MPALLGRWGEKQAAGYLHQKGYRLLAAGYRCRMGEIDLIAQKGRELAFVEVKLRRNARFAEPREQVTAPQNSGASCWRRGTSSPSTRNMVSITARFDVAEVYAPDGLQTAEPEIRYYGRAFVVRRCGMKIPYFDAHCDTLAVWLTCPARIWGGAPASGIWKSFPL